MIVNKLCSFSVVLMFLLTIECSYTQVDVGTDTTTVVVEPASDVICSTCACADGVVDCSNLNITTFFEVTDWDGLQDFKPLVVNLSFNPIPSVTRFGHLPIQELNLSNCDITSFEDETFNRLEDLRVLDLSRNMISTSAINRRVFFGPLTPPASSEPPGPKDYKRIQSLSVAYNELHSLPQDIFLFMPGLTYLDLSGNPLAYIDQVTMGAISDLKNLRELRLSGCELDTLPVGLLRRQRKLRRLDLSNNLFTTIPAVLQEVPSLVYLNLDKISLQTLEPSSISNLTKLQELHMTRLSRLQNITAGALGGLSDLVVLHLNNNPRLTNLDPDFLMWRNKDDEELWPTLKELYLNNNNLSGIDSGFLDTWQDLETGDFSGNPYNCDCSNQWMVDVLVPLLISTPANSTINNMVCRKPSDLRGLSLRQLNNVSKTLVCSQSESITEAPVANMAILLGIMIGIVVTFPLVLVLVLLWRRGFFYKFRSHKNDPRHYEYEAEDL